MSSYFLPLNECPLCRRVDRVGVKNADENELQSIASEPDEGHVYNVADFSIMSSIVEGLTKIVCEQVQHQDKEIKTSKSLRSEEEWRVMEEMLLLVRHVVVCEPQIFSVDWITHEKLWNILF